jgi:Protein of unknown function (DUF3375)
VKAVRLAGSYLALREGRVWKLLAADHGPLVMAVLQSLFDQEDKTLAVSVAVERVTRDLDLLRAQGHEMPQTAQLYLGDWLSQGWLIRRFPTGAHEEVFELSSEAASALRWIESLHKPRAAATESRLASVMQQVIRLAEETDANPKTRLASLKAERDRIDQEIAAVERGGVRTLPDDRAVERAREVIALAQELASDFRNVRDAFDRLNRDLRQSLMENDGSRGDVLEHLFAGVDLIAESDPGRAFAAFWRLLTDGEQSYALTEALDAIAARGFTRRLEARERKFLQSLTAVLMDEGGEVHEVLQQFARSLKSFVQSREFQEQRRLHSLLKQAQQAALAVRDVIRPNETIAFTLSLTSSRIRSASQWALYDPAMRVPDSAMEEAEESELTVDAVEALVRQSEIDFRTLREHVKAMLLEASQVTVADILERFPAEQGFGSVVGYVALGARHAEVAETTQRVYWTGKDGVDRSARIPAIYFTRERLIEFAD